MPQQFADEEEECMYQLVLQGIAFNKDNWIVYHLLKEYVARLEAEALIITCKIKLCHQEEIRVRIMHMPALFSWVCLPK